MEALAALSFACNVIQLVESGCKAASIFKQAYKDGTTKRNTDLSFATQRLSTCLDEFKQTPSLQLQDEEKALFELGCRVASTAELLYNTVKNSTEDSSASTRKKLKNGWRSLRDTGAIKEHEAKLRLYQETLNTSILVDLRKRFTFADVQNRQDFNQLSTVLQTFIREQATVQHEEHQKTRNIVQQEAAVTRQDLSVKLDSMAIEDEIKATRQQFLNSLRLPDMNKRKTDISYSHTGTFEWILASEDDDPSNQHNDQAEFDETNKLFKIDGLDEQEDKVYKDFWSRQTHLIQRDSVKTSDFVTWLVTDNDNYWICGKAGSGKSTLMRFISEHKLSKSYLRQWAGARELNTVEVYIWNAGSEAQKSYRGVLATILFQLMEQADDKMLDLLANDLRYQRKVSITDWYIGELESTIMALVEDSARCFCFFVDGLDELEVQQRLEADDVLLRFINRISIFSDVKCCISSRPERLFEISFQKTKQLRLEKLNAGDIRRLCTENVKQTIEEAQITLNATDLRELSYLIELFVGRAGGVFLWAHLVLEQIRRGIRAHDEIHELIKYLDSLPAEIVKLYEHMWAKNNGDLLEHREEAASFINLVLLLNHLTILTDLKILNLVQFALMFDQKLCNNPVASFKSGDMFKACMRFKGRVSVRSAGLLHVVGDDTSRDPSANDYGSLSDFESLRNFRVQFIHRTAKDFLLTESVGQKLRSEASVPINTLYKQFLHILLLEQSLFPEQVNYNWLHEFLAYLQMHGGSFRPSENAEILNELANVCENSVQQQFMNEGQGYIFQPFMMRGFYDAHVSSAALFPLDLNAHFLRHGLSSSLSDSIQRNQSQYNPEYCAYLLCTFRFWYCIDVDRDFYKVVSMLLKQLLPTTGGVRYIQCLVSDARIGRHMGVRCSLGTALVDLMFGSLECLRKPRHLHQTLSLAALYLKRPCFLDNGLLVLSFTAKGNLIIVEWPRHTIECSGIGFLIECNLRDIIHWYHLRGSTLEIDPGEHEVICVPMPVDHRWKVTVKALVLDSTSFKPSVKDCATISEMLSRSPVALCPIKGGLRIDSKDEYWRTLSEHAIKACNRSPRQKWLEILAHLEYLIPPDDPRVMKRPPPMLLDTPMEGSGEGLDEDEEDEFFDAVG